MKHLLKTLIGFSILSMNGFSAMTLSESGHDIYVESLSNNDVAGVQALVDEGVDIDACDDNGYTLLVLAAARGKLDIVNFLIDQGADVNAREFVLRRGALDYAAQFGYEEIVEVLVKANVDVSAVNTYGKTALDYAIEGNQVKMAKLLINPTVDFETIAYEPFYLIKAIRYDRIEIAQLLIDAGVDLNVCDRFCKNALWYAMQQGHLNLVKNLIHQGATLDKVAYNDLEIKKLYSHLQNHCRSDNEWQPFIDYVEVKVSANEGKFLGLFKGIASRTSKRYRTYLVTMLTAML